MSSPSRTLIFVYGTLKRGCRNHYFLAGQIFLGEARTVPGFRLFDLGDFPGMVAQDKDTEGVAGELWSIDADGLARLDRLEGLGEGLYRRVAIALAPPFSDYAAETYLYARDTRGRREIGSAW